MEPYRLWHALPQSVRSRLRDTTVFDTGRRLNDWLWRTDWYARIKYDFTTVPVAVDGFETQLYLPESGRPWWREYERHGCHEPLASRTLLRTIEHGDTFWDMGSRFGYFSTIAALANDTPERVHVFEPRVSNWRLVEENNRAVFGGAMHVNNVGVGATERDRTMSGDAYADAHGPPDAVKMDIEGAEVAAIRGMERLLEQQRPLLIVEGHPDLIPGNDRGDTDETLLELLREYYEGIMIAFDFRSSDGQWEPVAAHWDRRFERRELSDDEYDQYQLLCRPD